MAIAASKADINSMTSFQKLLHEAEMEEPIQTIFHRDFIKSTWYAVASEKLERKDNTGDEQVIYKVNPSFHRLMSTKLCFTTPVIRVKPKFSGKVKVAWCHNLGTNVVLKASFAEDDQIFHTIDNTWLDIYPQFYERPGAGMRENYNIGVGNVEILENFSENLPAYPISVDQVWYYSMDSALSFPIFFKNSQTRAEHRYTFRRSVASLLRVKKLKENGDPNNPQDWEDIIKGIHKYLNIKADQKMPIPELWGKYVYTGYNEMEFYKNFCSGSDTYTYFTRDVVCCDDFEHRSYGDQVSINLSCKYPTLAMFWVAENQIAKLKHNYSNYTTNSDDLYTGWPVIKNVEMIYQSSGERRLEMMFNHHFSIDEARANFPSSPSERGYNCYSFCNDSCNYNAEPGLVFDGLNCKIIFRLSDGNIMSSIHENQIEDESDDEDLDPDLSHEMERYKNLALNKDSPTFIVRVRLLIVKKLTVLLSEKGDYKMEISM